MARRNEIRPLTGIRGIAALLVAVYHLNGPDAPTALRVHGVAGTVVSHGYLAVDLFFVLSGFVIALSYSDMLRTWDGRLYARFLIRRIARVYPLFAVITLVVGILLLTGLSHEPVDHPAAALGYNMLMVQAWGFAPSLDGPAWSISTEWAAYLLFPLLAAVTLFGRPRTAAVVAMAASLCVVAMAVLPSDEPVRNGPLDVYGPGISVTRCVAEFSLGLLTFRLASYPVARAFGRHPLTGVILAGAILLLLTRAGTDLFLVALFPPLVLALAVGGGPLQRLCGSPPIFLLGELSYAIYLLHTRLFRVRDGFDGHLHHFLGGLTPAVASIFAYVVLLGASWIAYRYLETPARSLVRRVERWIPAPPILPAASVGAGS